MSGTVHSSRTGVALIMVILILAGLLAIAVPLVYICRSNETSAARTLDQEIARRYALSALELAKGQLRRGTYENEFRATYPPPTAAPTPTPANAANLAPYNTPDYDAGPELIVPQAELDKAIPKVLPNGDTLSVSVEVEDEQGKLNLNSITPRLLRGLYMAVFRIDPKDLSADDRAALKARFEHLIDPIACMRFSSGTYTPLRSVEQIRNFSNESDGKTWRLTEPEYEAMRPYLTVNSWRPSEGAFKQLPESTCEIYLPLDSQMFEVARADCPYRVDLLDTGRHLLQSEYCVTGFSEQSEDEIYNQPMVTLQSDPPDGACFAAFTPEEFHPVNLNAASTTVLLAFCLAALDLDSPQLDLSTALSYVSKLRVSGSIRSVEKISDGYRLSLTPDSGDFTPLACGIVFCAGRYISLDSAEVGSLHTTDDLSWLASSIHPPLPVSGIILGEDWMTHLEQNGGWTPASAYMKPADRKMFTVVSYDVYSLRSDCLLISPEGIEKARWEVSETVSIGGSACGPAEPYVLNYLTALEQPMTEYPSQYTAPPRCVEVADSWWCDLDMSTSAHRPALWLSPLTDQDYSGISGLLDFVGLGALRPVSSGVGLAPGAISTAAPHMFSSALLGAMSYSNGKATITFYEMPVVSGQNTDEFEIVLESAPSRSDVRQRYWGSPRPGIEGSSGLVIAGWFKAQGWVPSSDPAMHRIFTQRNPESKGPGSTELFVRAGDLVLRVEDDCGASGEFSCRLTDGNFPPDTWMFIVCHIFGNQRDQCSIFLDSRPVPLDYACGSADETGDCCRIAAEWAYRAPSIVEDTDADDSTLKVDSTSGYPACGYFRVDNEIIYYESRTLTSFCAIHRQVGSTERSTLAPGSQVLPAAFLESGSRIPDAYTAGRTVTLVTYEQLYDGQKTINEMARSKVHAPISFRLDMDAVRDGKRWGVIIAAPRDYAFGTTSSLGWLTRAYVGTSGTITSGAPETGLIHSYFLASPGTSDGFQGDCAFPFIGWPLVGITSLPRAIGASDTSPHTPIWTSLSNRTMLVQLDSEIIGYDARDTYSPVIHRGLLGTTPAAHAAGTKCIPLPFFEAVVFPSDIGPDTKSFDYRSYSLRDNCWRVDDEILYLKRDSSPAEDREYCSLIRGLYGSTPSAHAANSFAIKFTSLAPSIYDFSNPLGPQTGVLEVRRHRPGMLLSALSWQDLSPDPYVLIHAWADVADDHDFVREPVSPNVFHFTSKSKDFSILRNGEPILTDNVTVRVMHEYLRGAWLPNDPTRHSWKVLPQIDKIELWIQEPDVVFEHREHP